MFLSHLQLTEDSYLYYNELIQELSTVLSLDIKLNTIENVAEYETKLLKNVERWYDAKKDLNEHSDALSIVISARQWHSFSSQHAWNTWQFATILCQKL